MGAGLWHRRVGIPHLCDVCPSARLTALSLLSHPGRTR
ncbi:hypothetical protein DB30_04326 [Enhygromyxa salina]|uniref:Uncharacterized protein n=1 Tax=Enhygromyxa salina TaxID=215803 RepID=A0A0C2D4E5_9BACT|nr:hypothetical protein DB30_04326 [Enhygromyxa salina]